MLCRIMRRAMTSAISALLVSGGVAAPLAAAPAAHATEWVYVLNVTVRPVYGFADSGQALSYGYGICDELRVGRGYPQLVSDLKSDFSTNDEFTVSYLVSQAAQELCPDLIWQLRKSAGGYRPTA